MEIKGTAVQSVKTYVKTHHPEHFQQWISMLPEGSRQIFVNSITVSDWLPAMTALITPTEMVGKLLYKNDVKKGAWELGRYSAETALTGVYKVFLLIASPSYIIGRASKVFATYYRPLEMEVVEKTDKKVVMHMFKCDHRCDIVSWRIGGWVEKALEMCGGKNVQVHIRSFTKDEENVTEFLITWD